VIDNNAVAQEKGLEATLAYVENAAAAGKYDIYFDIHMFSSVLLLVMDGHDVKMSKIF